MLQWGIEQCKREGTPAYLESTVEAAPLYEKNGWSAVETFSLALEGVTANDAIEKYTEISFLFEPCPPTTGTKIVE